ncbi:DNA-processing protein DprA [Thermosipho ferrireducens]|uniref:DNA-processing protein DprA n=1 Tax=Thermosipho ferrireducens TaxID=2571116 RepID=A0ABX7S581_9BACT|nr:DNA-processing protein DprA [Thermosipho ferrireducens]QTA37669.1 DNA-processing protein DprA [Thermosipho ferrireducens]
MDNIELAILYSQGFSVKDLEAYRNLNVKFESVVKRTGKIEIEDIYQKIKQDLKNQKYGIVSFWDEEYPELLKNIWNPPAILFYKGDFSLLNSECFAVVGTRKATQYGRRVTETFVSKLSKKFVIISGLAFGIDTIAHTIALKEGKTVAVLGSGVEYCYPRSNSVLYENIISNGCVISEYLPWSRPKKYTFPERNRLIAGVSKGVLVTEAGRKSGAIITANFAADFGRDVFSIPGDIYRETSTGTNYLIKNGAQPVTDPGEILEFYGFVAKKEKIEISKVEWQILELLEEKTFDEIAIFMNMSVSDLLIQLTVLELKGLVYKSEDGTYKKGAIFNGSHQVYTGDEGDFN